MMKAIGIVAMAGDHLNKSLLNEQYDFLYWFGRLALPIFVFLIARNYFLTRSPSRYAMRLFAFGVISQPFFYLALDAHYPNVLFTLGLCVLLLIAVDTEPVKKNLIILPLLVGALMFCDGGYIALPIVIFCYCVFRFFGVPMAYQFKRSCPSGRWFFYGFYPGHLLLLSLIGMVL